MENFKEQWLLDHRSSNSKSFFHKVPVSRAALNQVMTAAWWTRLNSAVGRVLLKMAECKILGVFTA